MKVMKTVNPSLPSVHVKGLVNEDPRCSSCVYGQSKDTTPDLKSIRYCRRSFPQVVAAGQSMGAGFPPVSDDAYCGEYQRVAV